MSISTTIFQSDFFTYSYEQWGGFDAEMFGITYKFTRVEEE